MLEPLYRAALTGTAGVVEVSYAKRVYVVHTLPVRNTSGAIFTGMVMTQDISERKALEEELRKSLQDVLVADGHEVYTAEGGQAGLEAFRAAQAEDKPFAVVITDLGMPNVDGRRVAQAVKQLAPATPVILLTGWG